MSAFAIGLLARAAVSALVVVGATVAAESAGAFWGGLIVSLPVAAGPAYVMLALQHDAGFIAATALSSLAVNAASFVFLAALALLVTRLYWGWALIDSLGAWACAVVLIRQVEWGVVGASLLNVGVVLACLAATRWVTREEAVRSHAVRRRWFELPVRAAMVGLMVGGVVTGSRTLGPTLTGMATVFPVAFTSFALLVLPRVDGAVAAAIMTSALRAMPGLALALLTLHLTAVPLGVWTAQVLALVTSLAWSAMLMLGRGRRLWAARQMQAGPPEGGEVMRARRGCRKVVDTADAIPTDTR